MNPLLEIKDLHKVTHAEHCCCFLISLAPQPFLLCTSAFVHQKKRVKGTERNKLMLICFNSEHTNANSKCSLNIPSSLHLCPFQVLSATLSSLAQLNCLSFFFSILFLSLFFSSPLSVWLLVSAKRLNQHLQNSAKNTNSKLPGVSTASTTQMCTAILLKITHTMRYAQNPGTPPSARHTHPHSNWQLLLAHLSAVPLCSPTTFHQSNYNFIQE